MKSTIAMLAAFCLAAPRAGAVEMPVFFASGESAAVRQNALNAELATAGITATVFARYQDFESEISRNVPALVLAPAAFGDTHPGFRAALRLAKSGQTFSKGVLLALNAEGAALPAEKSRLGAVQEFNREEAPALLGKTVGRKFKSIKLVTKSEDLFPLLMFRSADVILVAQDALPRLREKFTVSTVQASGEVRLEHPVLFVRNGLPGLEKSIAAVRALSMPTLAALGFTAILVVEASPAVSPSAPIRMVNPQ